MDMSLRRFANVLALVATLALALVPTLGRGWMAHAQPAMHGAHHAAHDAADDEGGLPTSSDCDYCLIASAFALAGVAPPLHAPWHHGMDAAAIAPRTAAASAPGGGLGARGPPDIG